MAKVTFNVSNSDPNAVGSIEPPKPGVYQAKVKQCKPGFPMVDGSPDQSRPRLEVIYEVTSKQHRGAYLYDYIPTANEAAAWKLDQFLQAFGVATAKKRKGTFDTDDLLGEACTVRVVGDTYNGSYTAKVKAVLPPADEDDDESDLEEDEDEDELDEEIDEEDDLEDDEEEEDEEDEEAPESDDLLSEDDLMAMGVVALKKILRDDFDVKPPATKDKAKIVALILEAQGGEDEEEDEDEEEAEDYDSWDLADLKAECEARGLKAVGRKSVLIERLQENDEEDNPF